MSLRVCFYLLILFLTLPACTIYRSYGRKQFEQDIESKLVSSELESGRISNVSNFKCSTFTLENYSMDFEIIESSNEKKIETVLLLTSNDQNLDPIYEHCIIEVSESKYKVDVIRQLNQIGVDREI